MATKGKQRLAKLFRDYSANLSACFPATEVTDTFLCPFCKTTFGLKALDHPPKVAVAHCIPKSLGGTLVTLCCAKCDNNSGTTVDVHLKNRFETEEFFQATTPHPRKVWLTIGERQTHF